MSDFNMLSSVPYNVNVPEFQPERSAPVFPVVTRKYRCIEDVVTQDYARFDTLTWKIQQPDQSMVWQSVKLVLPLEMKAYRIDQDTGVDAGNNMPNPLAELDMRVTSQLPACNIAVAESPMGAFRQSSLTINGRIFSEVNDFRRTLDSCYRGTGPSSYGDNHSLKPVVCRDIKKDTLSRYNLKTIVGGQPVDQQIGNRQAFVDVADSVSKTLDSTFSLLEHNGPFLERARKFQDELSYDGKTWTGLITNYLELGPFQARARLGNTAVPYVRDLHLRLNFDTNPSKFDAIVGTGMNELPRASCQVIPGKLFEFGTVANLKHFGETINNYKGFIGGMKLRYTEKPYLEVQYVRYIEPMKSFYNLRCFEHQYEQSNPFNLHAAANTRVSPTSLQRVTSRLLSYPTKVYLYASLSDSEQYPWGMGNVRRSCLLKNIHCRVNQRPDIVFNPSQEECYQMFRRHTNSSLEYGSWLKAPIYVFDPVDLGQPDMLANDARLSLMEWDAEISLTPLQIQEQLDMKDKEALIATGYNRAQFDRLNYVPADDGNTYNSEYAVEYDYAGVSADDFDPATRNYGIIIAAEEDEDAVDMYWADADGQRVLHNNYQFRDEYRTGIAGASPTTEIIRCTSVTRAYHFIRGFIWAKVDMANGAVLNNKIYYVPRSFNFSNVGDHDTLLNKWSALTTIVANDGTITYTVPQGTINVFQGRIRGGALNNTLINGAAGHRTNGMVPGATAFLVDRVHGIDNQNTAGNAAGTPGPLQPGGDYEVANQRTSADHQWVCFRPDAAMVAGTGPDAKILQWKNTNAGENQTAGHQTPLGKGNACLTMRGACDRNQVLPIDLPAQAELQTDAQCLLAQPMNQILMHTADTHKFDYTLKALYEYGNCQYQFTSDGQPTKVLPNLVPVRDSTAIPIV